MGGILRRKTLRENPPATFHEPVRRVLFQDVVKYRKRSMSDRHEALDELAFQAQQLGMGY